MPTTRERNEPPVDGVVEMSLANDATAPADARRVVREALILWHLPALVDSCVLATSELVTNAVRHGLPPITLLMRHRSGNVRIEVNDARPEGLAATRGLQVDSMAESGRGLGLVRGLADKLGSERVPGDGKNVYASWDVDAKRPGHRR